MRLTAMLAFAILISGCCDTGVITDIAIDGFCIPAPEPDECCADHGAVAGKPDMCAASEEPYCIGCDGEPVLCWTVGCEAPCDPSSGTCSEDCCLADDGETVPCESSCTALAEVALVELCMATPLGEGAACDYPPTSQRCLVVTASLVKCDAFTVCDYVACAEAMAEAACDTPATEIAGCEAMTACLDTL